MSDTPARRGAIFASICAFSYLSNFGRVVFAPLVDVFMRDFHVGAATAGLVATMVWFGSALPRLPTGYLLTRVERHHAILGMGVFLVCAAAFTGLAPGIYLVAAGALFVGCATGVFYIAANPLVTELYPKRVGWAVGLRGMSSQLAALSAPLFVGVALAFDWRVLFYAVAGAAVLATAALALTTRDAEMPTAGESDRHLLRAVRAEWRLVCTGVAILGVAGFIWQGVFNFYVPYLTAKGFDPSTARTLLTAVFAAGVPAFVLSGRVADRVRSVPYLLGVVAAFCCCLLALTLADGLLAVAAVSLVLGYVVHSLFPAMDTYLLGTLPDENRASAYSAYSAVMMLCQAPGSLVVGALVEAGFAYATVFRGWAAVLVALVVVVGAFYRAGHLPTSAVGPGAADA